MYAARSTSKRNPSGGLGSSWACCSVGSITSDLGQHRLRTITRIINANGVKRSLARKVAWAMAMSTAAYGVGAIWENQGWMLDSFNHLTAIGQAVAGTFSTAKAEDAIQAADTPPARPALARRRERLLLSTLAAPEDAPRRLLLPASPEDDSSRHRIPRWLTLATASGPTVDTPIRDGQKVEKSTPRRRLPLGCTDLQTSPLRT